MEAQPAPLPRSTPNAARPVGPGRGWLLVGLGVSLSAGMAFLMNWLYQATRHHDDPGASTHWRGGAELTWHVFGLFASVFVFGLVTTASGVYVLRTRRINPALRVTMRAVFVVMAYCVYTVMRARVPAP